MKRNTRSSLCIALKAIGLPHCSSDFQILTLCRTDSEGLGGPRVVLRLKEFGGVRERQTVVGVDVEEQSLRHNFPFVHRDDEHRIMSPLSEELPRRVRALIFSVGAVVDPDAVSAVPRRHVAPRGAQY
eukprot:Selendium_serpulae@DN4177_c0_g1_i2.p1